MFEDKVLVFDVDATLYPASSGLEAESEELCIDFFVKRLGFDYQGAQEEIARLRRQEKYETALVEHFYGIPQQEYLEYICAMDVTPLLPNIELDNLLKSLPQRKLILTDSTVKHTQEVLQKLAVDPQRFERIFDAQAGNFLFKYRDELFVRFFDEVKIKAPEMVLFEDSLSNLRKAKSLGAYTILISETEIERPDYVDMVFGNINQALKTISA